ncbi:MAG: alkaline phosphatase D family protein [bacterium]
MSAKIGFHILLSIFIVLPSVYVAAQGVEQYKQQARDVIAKIVDGEMEASIDEFMSYLAKHPGDLESLYGLAIVYAQQSEIEKAMEFVNQALDGGLPFERFVAGPRNLLEPLVESAEFQELSKRYPLTLIHGPMLGCVTENSAKFWVRTADEAAVQVLVKNPQNMESAIESKTVKTKKGNDFTAVVSVSGIEPDTRYYYEILVDGVKEPRQWSFRTFPLSASKAKFHVGFGGGAGYTPKYERMWNTVASRNPLAFLFLGDNVYIDNPTRPAVQQYCYYRRHTRPEFRDFISARSVYAIWDDHDFTTNDGWGGPEIHDPSWKIPVWRLFCDNWNNPGYGGGEAQPGCWFSFSIADVDFFMLDGRYYRTDPKSETLSMLGPVQKAWLCEKLRLSKGTFKVLASPVPWSFGTKPGSLDTWEGYQDEREEIFSFIEKNRIEGVVLISADRHRSDAWKIERPNGYRLYEFESSKLTNIHTHKIMPGALFGYNDKCSFGFLSFDTTSPDPTVSFEIINIDNELIHKLTLKRSQLGFMVEGENG